MTRDIATTSWPVQLIGNAVPGLGETLTNTYAVGLAVVVVILASAALEFLDTAIECIVIGKEALGIRIEHDRPGGHFVNVHLVHVAGAAGGEGRRKRRRQNPRNPERVGDPAGMQGSIAAVGQNIELLGLVAPRAQFDRDAGSRTVFAYLKMFVDAGLQVSLWPDNLHRDRGYAKVLQDLGIEVLYGQQLIGRFPEWITENGAYLDYVLFSRAHIALEYIGQVTEHTRARRLYYGHDLHAVRLEREYAINGRQQLLSDIEFWRKAEIAIWKQADVIYYPAQDEVDAARRELPGKTARVLTPYIYSDREIAAARAQVEDGSTYPPSILFVGGFGHRPNVDAAIWLDVSEETVRARISGRLQCRTCGFTTSVDSAKFADRPICPYCEGRLERRSDDDMSVLQTRLREYNTKTQPLADYYGKMSILRRIDGNRDRDTVFADISRLIEEKVPA